MKARDTIPYWADARDLLVQAVERLDDDQLDWRPNGLDRSIRDVLRHLVESEHEWLDLLVSPDTDDGAHQSVDVGGAQPLTELLALMESASHRIEPFLDMEVEELRERRVQFGTGAEFNCHWALVQMYEHEIHHRGQVFMLMRMQGLEPPET